MLEHEEIVLDPSEFESQEEREKTRRAWENLFAEVKKFSEEVLQPANYTIFTGNIKVNLDDGTNYKLLIHPTILSEDENPEIIIVDLNYLDKLSQRWVAKAVWDDEDPTVIQLDPSRITIEGIEFSSHKIADEAIKAVRKSQQAAIINPAKAGKPLMVAPKSYPKGIN